MTYQQLYLHGRNYLEKAGIDSPAFDAFRLFSHCFSMERPQFSIRGREEAPREETSLYLKCLERRSSGEPLQYLLGEWEFMGLPFFVGKGVLIPRDDTEIVVSECARRLGEAGRTEPVAADLCAGSGAVSIGLCSLIPQARVTAVELSEDALGYLTKNIARNRMERITAVRGDVLSESSLLEDGSLDALVSNPPYIPSDDIACLQKEVHKEPRLALDGGADGLVFYRAIAGQWLRKLKPGGVAAVEVGIHQAEEVARLFAGAGLGEICIAPDLAGIPRAVSGLR